MFEIMSVVNFEIPACHRRAAVHCDFSRMRRGSLNWCDMVMCVLNNGLVINFLWQRRN